MFSVSVVFNEAEKQFHVLAVIVRRLLLLSGSMQALLP
jgi:hypothetical protein